MTSSLRPIIAPSVLASDLSCLRDESQRMVDEKCDWLHLDVMDGHFVPNITMGPPVIASLRKHLPYTFFDVHLMVSNPAVWVDPMAKAGASMFTFHWEAVENPMEVADLARKIKAANMRVGLAIKPKTPYEDIKTVLSMGVINMLLVMTVEPGFGGQSFMRDTLVKIRAARAAFPNLDIQVDGGLDAETIKDAAAHGANVIVAGTSIFKSENPAVLMEYMRDVIVASSE